MSCVGIDAERARGPRRDTRRPARPPSRPTPVSAVSQLDAPASHGASRPSRRRSTSRAQIADRARQLVAARRRLAEPERNRRRRALARRRRARRRRPTCRTRHDALPSWKTSPARALDREVLVQRADERVVRLEDDAVVGDLGDRAARGDARAAARRGGRARVPLHLVAVDAARARRPRRVAKPSAAIAHDRVEVAPRRGRGTARRGAPARTARPRAYSRHARLGDDLLRQHVERRVVRDDARRARRAGPRAAAPRTRPGRRARSGTAGPSAVPAIVWPDRPTRCRSVAMRCGEPIWQTRSTWPMSMPSSSDAVATSAFSCPVFSRVSASSRFSFDRLPWCAVTASSPSRSLRWRATRSAIRRVLTKTSVVRCCAISSASRS